MDNGEDYFPSKEIIEAWDAYTDYLKNKYPAPEGEDWKFTCEHHQRIDDAVDGIKQIERWRTSLTYSILFAVGWMIGLRTTLVVRWYDPRTWKNYFRRMIVDDMISHSTRIVREESDKSDRAKSVFNVLKNMESENV